MKKIICIIAAFTLTVWGCSSDDESSTPTESGIMTGNDARPTWQSPDYMHYEQSMSVFLNLQSELKAYSSSQDMLCAIVDNEVRGVAYVDTAHGGFALTIAGNSSTEVMTLSYYCDRLHRIFTLKNWATFDSGIKPTGTGELYNPRFPL